MHAAFGNDLAVEVGQFFQQPDIFHNNGPRGPAVLLFWVSTTGAPKAVVWWLAGRSPSC